MIEVNTVSDLDQYVGRELGTSEWTLIDQARIDAFARITGDFQWMHVDIERARAEMPDGKTIAHGYLILSLVAGLAPGLLRIARGSREINYGSDRVRFITPVQSGARVRLATTLKSIQAESGGHRIVYEHVIQIEGHDRPALVAETISLIFD
jgi:acyl dehydratase